MPASKSEKASNTVENSADATIVLPEGSAANTDLSERELEAVAGGTWISPASAATLADLVEQATRPPDPAP